MYSVCTTVVTENRLSNMYGKFTNTCKSLVPPEDMILQLCKEMHKQRIDFKRQTFDATVQNTHPSFRQLDISHILVYSELTIQVCTLGTRLDCIYFHVSLVNWSQMSNISCDKTTQNVLDEYTS